MFEKDRKSKNKIKKETQIYWHGKNSQLKWSDIKHLELEDDDLITSSWVEDHEAEYGGYWHGEITRMVEETDAQFQKRMDEIEQQDKWAKEQRYKSYLKLKAEFENETTKRNN
jgi:hypothetical protein